MDLELSRYSGMCLKLDAYHCSYQYKEIPISNQTNNNNKNYGIMVMSHFISFISFYKWRNCDPECLKDAKETNGE